VLAQLAAADGAPAAEPPTRRLVGLVGATGVPVRAGAEILDAASGAPVGRVTSGTVSPTLGRPVMLAYVERAALDAKAPLAAAVRQQRPAVDVATLPFVPKRYKR
jgi:aminomethyltransferase